MSADEGGDVLGDDIYSYTKLGDFTSEIFKIELSNLPRYVGYGELKKLLFTGLELQPRKIKVFSKHHYAFVTFKSEEDRENALGVLNGYEYKGRTLLAKTAQPIADPLIAKRKAGDSEDCYDAKKLKEDDELVEVKCKNAVTPYWNVPYEEQLEMKQKETSSFLIKLGHKIEKMNPLLKSIIKENRKNYESQCCKLDPIKASPVTTGYRNKCEFTVGKHLQTKEKTVGFRLAQYKKGSVSVAEPDDCINISPAMLKAVKSFQDYIRQSEKDVYNPETHEGFWRQLTVRTSNNGDVLIIVMMHPQSLPKEELDAEQENLRDYYSSGQGSSCGVTSVFFNLVNKAHVGQDDALNMVHLLGKEFLEETLLGMTFQVNPKAFFQVNVPAAEILYETVISFVDVSSSPNVIDICSGTGTISLCLAKAGIRTIGIEMCEVAVENARKNVEINGIKNVEFICGKAESFIHNIIAKCDGHEIVAIADPPRAGLHQKVIKAIRESSEIKKLIYISCNPVAAMTNFIDLCRTTSNNFKGCPFYPVKAVAVDLFPHTVHKELVLVFERSNLIKNETV